MNYLTTTNLRTQTSKLVKILKQNGKVTLIHRSEMIGVIEPIRASKPFDSKAFLKIVKEMNLPQTTDEEREKRYRDHLMEKYGQGLKSKD